MAYLQEIFIAINRNAQILAVNDYFLEVCARSRDKVIGDYLYRYVSQCNRWRFYRWISDFIRSGILMDWIRLHAAGRVWRTRFAKVGNGIIEVNSNVDKRSRMKTLFCFVAVVFLSISGMGFAGEPIILDDLPDNAESSRQTVILDGPVNESGINQSSPSRPSFAKENQDLIEMEKGRLKEKIAREKEVFDNMPDPHFHDQRVNDEIRQTHEDYIDRLKAKKKELENNPEQYFYDQQRAVEERSAKKRVAEEEGFNKSPHDTFINGNVGNNTGTVYNSTGNGGLVNSRNGTVYTPAGPNGVIDTKTGKYIPRAP